MKLDITELEAADFRAYETRKPYAVAFWQKALLGEDCWTKLLFINVHQYVDFPPYPEPTTVNYEVEARMYGKDFEFDLKLLFLTSAAVVTSTEIESFFRDAYTRLGCVPDRNNNGM